MPSYHFDLGNSSTGPIGFCASITAPNRKSAVKILKSHLESVTGGNLDLTVYPQLGRPSLPPNDYIAVYFNADQITTADIDSVERNP